MQKLFVSVMGALTFELIAFLIFGVDFVMIPISLVSFFLGLFIYITN